MQDSTKQDAAHTIITPTELRWVPSPRVPGIETANVVGDVLKPGSLVYRVKFPPNFIVQAHTDPDERTFTVLSGTWYVGWGKKFDESKLMGLPAGSFYIEPANVPHFVATKGDGAIVQITGVGPRSIPKYIDPAHAPKT